LYFKVLFDGKPVTDHEVSGCPRKDQFSEQSDVEKLTTNAKGQASFTPSAQDVYLMQVRLRTDAPEGAEVPTYSYTTTLSFEAY
jgi:Nickel uptake substrate-specific transmembrane region.